MLQNKERQKEITQIISRDENTPELAQYWGRKYLEVLDEGLFVLDSRFLEIFGEGQISSFVPAGHLSLCAHLDKENRLDEDLLVGTVETSIRLLDALVNYLWKQKNIIEVGKNRVISLGLDDVDEFFERYNTNSSDNDEDEEYNAQLVGETAYRASEFIAEEKGPFDSYDEIKYDIKENYFDTWVDEKDNIKSNQEIQKLKNEVQAGKYSLLPRRNLAILNFATEKNWSKYSDSKTISDVSKTLKNSSDLKDTVNKPFNIKLNTENSETTTKNKINNHVDEIFEHLLKERQNLDSRPQAIPKAKAPEPKEESELSVAIPKIDNEPSFAKDIRLYILINNNKKTVFAKHDNRLTLPFVSLDDNNNNLEKAIWEGVLKKYNLLINIDREFTVLYDPLKHRDVINIGYLADLQNDTLPPDLFWAAPENEDFIDEVSYKLLTRYKGQSRELEAENFTQSPVQPITQSLLIKPAIQQNISNYQELPAIVEPGLKTELKPVDPQLPKPKIEKLAFKKISQPKLLYSLKLEQKIQTKTFGVVQIIFEYTKKFPQIEDFKCDKLAVGDKHALDVIINLINLLLTNSYSLEYIEKYLEEKVRKDEANNINNFITVFIFAMREVPSDLNELIELLAA